MLSIVNKKIVMITTIVMIFVMYFLLDYYMFSVKQKNIIYGNDIIKIFEKNQIKFVLVKEFIEKEEGSFSAVKSDRTSDIIIKNNMAIEDSAKESLLYIIEKLNFCSVNEYDTYIEFRKEEGDHPRGVIFLKSNTTMPKYVLNSKKIRDSWYYYSTDNV